MYFSLKSGIEKYLLVPNCSLWLHIRMQVLLMENFQVLVNMFLYDLKLFKTICIYSQIIFVVIVNNLL